jgi:hypothetical protein
MAVSGQRYQVVYVQYPLDEVPFDGSSSLRVVDLGAGDVG